MQIEITEKAELKAREQRNEEVKRWLDRYRNEKRKIRRLQLEYEEMVSSQESVTAVTYDGVQVTGGGDNTADLANIMVRRDQYLTKIIKAQARLEEIRREITEALEQLDSDEAEVLSYRYIQLDGFEQRTWEEICVLTHCSWRKAHHLHSDGLDTLAQIIGIR